MNTEKITADQLQRKAVVYVRQSTLEQLRHNHESRGRQYELAGLARSLGWQQVEVIDEDLGRSGTTTVGRSGFQRLVGSVGLREIGAVVSLEVSRLARNNRDWYQLLDLCALTETLIIDFDGVYDPRLLNDRMLLGLKGTMSEFEVGLFRQRSGEAIRRKASRGELFGLVPVGYVRSADGRCEQDPDLRVRQAVQTVFDRFDEQGSIRQVLLSMRGDHLLLPAWGWREGTRRIVWREPTYAAVQAILTNPMYGGAYAYGRRTTVTEVVDGHAARRKLRRRPMEEWQVLLPNHLPGYITWARYQTNQQRIRTNLDRVLGPEARRGAPRYGSALLAGLLRCRRCGRRLHVKYGGPGHIPRYSCFTAALHRGEHACIAFGGLRVDQAVEAELLRVVQPAALEAALQAWDLLQSKPDVRRTALELAIRQARYEADRARRQYDQVDPENRLVAGELERRWNTALQEVQRLEADLAKIPPPPPPPGAADRAALMALAHDFPAVWHDPSTDRRKQKQLARLLIDEIIVDTPEDDRVVDMVIHWAGGTHTQMRVRLPRVGQHRYATDQDVVDLVRSLATVGSDLTVASILNRLRIRTSKGNSWTLTRLRSFRAGHDIPAFSSATPRDWRTIEEAATILQVSRTTVHRLIQGKVIPARQIVPHAPWMIALADLDRPDVRAAAEAVRQGRRGPCTRHAAEQMLVPQDM